MKFVCTSKRPKMPVFPIVFTMQAFTSDLMKEALCDKFRKCVMLINEGYCEYFLDKESMNRLGKLFLDRLERDKNLIKRYFNLLNKRCSELIDVLTSTNLKAANDEIIGCIREYNRCYNRASIYGWPIAVIGEGILSEKIKKEIRKKSKDSRKAEELSRLLLQPESPSYTADEEIEALRIVLEGRYKDKKVIGEHAKKYSWIGFDYSGPAYNEKYFSARLAELAEEAKKRLRVRLARLQNYTKEARKEHEKVVRGLKLGQSAATRINALQDLIRLRDRKKELFTKAHFYVEPLLDEIEKRTKVKKELLRWLYVDEFERLLSGKGVYEETVKQRIKYSAIVAENGSIREYLGTDAGKYFKLLSEKYADVTEIKGVCGSPGKVKARVRILKSSAENNKLKKGQILVTTMTTVDIVPAMKRAAAVITDEGGITCHAAIVSRELGIPCIIGTRIATKVLHDGDLVEVDADKGIVRKVKR